MSNEREKASVEAPLDCWCGNPAHIEEHDNRYWVSCSGKSCKHEVDEYDDTMVGGYDGFGDIKYAVTVWNEHVRLHELRDVLREGQRLMTKDVELPSESKAAIEGLMADNAHLRRAVRRLQDSMVELYTCSRQTGCDACGYRCGCKLAEMMEGLVGNG